jgi:UTP:GlnB (protein PII) uridylyltransferase
MEGPTTHRLGLAEPVSFTEGNKPSPTTLLSDARQEYIAAARHGRAGRDVQTRYSGRLDALVQQLAESARVHSSAAMSVCALGGYGRKAL